MDIHNFLKNNLAPLGIVGLAIFASWWLMGAYERSEAIPGLILVDDPGKPRFLLKQDRKEYAFDLVDPNDAPESIRSQVLEGYKIFTYTTQYAREFTGDRITCNNCHFVGGNTLGGKGGGISLVGVSKEYPRFSKREGRKITLAERVNNCFERSLNGKPLPLTSPTMQALIAYLEWISHEVKDIPHLPWLGLRMIPLAQPADPFTGNKLYAQHCAACHGEQGGGSDQAPPLWGAQSFNNGAGMNSLETLSSFIYWNMPHQNPILSEGESIDIASYILAQPRPRFSQMENKFFKN